jgi:hypothetical protein
MENVCGLTVLRRAVRVALAICLILATATMSFAQSRQEVTPDDQEAQNAFADRLYELITSQFARNYQIHLVLLQNRVTRSMDSPVGAFVTPVISRLTSRLLTFQPREIVSYYNYQGSVGSFPDEQYVEKPLGPTTAQDIERLPPLKEPSETGHRDNASINQVFRFIANRKASLPPPVFVVFSNSNIDPDGGLVEEDLDPALQRLTNPGNDSSSFVLDQALEQHGIESHLWVTIVIPKQFDDGWNLVRVTPGHEVPVDKAGSANGSGGETPAQGHGTTGVGGGSTPWVFLVVGLVVLAALACWFLMKSTVTIDGSAFAVRRMGSLKIVGEGGGVAPRNVLRYEIPKARMMQPRPGTLAEVSFGVLDASPILRAQGLQVSVGGKRGKVIQVKTDRDAQVTLFTSGPNGGDINIATFTLKVGKPKIS